ncbi:hypothetical protein F4825DRAFT_455920 [Nemania diffusa]|nr:hypothetical protein F4825DRAFT_455920 [Nemania diffusa]
MKCLAILALLGITQAHYTFPGLIYNSVTEADWTYVRKTTNRYSHGPVQDVSDSQIRCYEITPGSNGAGTKTRQSWRYSWFSRRWRHSAPGSPAVLYGQSPSRPDSRVLT